MDTACPRGATLECYLWNTWLIGSVSIATAAGLRRRARGFFKKRSFWLHRLSPVCSPNYTDPLCAFSLSTYNTGIDGSHGYSGLRTEANWSSAGWLFTVLVKPGVWLRQSVSTLGWLCHPMNRTDDCELLFDSSSVAMQRTAEMQYFQTE